MTVVQQQLVLSACRVDLSRATVTRGQRVVRLTRLEHALLAYLAARPGQVITREELLEQVWGYRQGVRTRTLDSTVQRLRGKVERDPKQPIHLKTAYGIGFRFEPPEETAEPSSPAPTAAIVYDATTSFVGRAPELQHIADRFADGARLLTLLGTAGAGKTRLARRYASCQLLPAHFVDLSAVESRHHVLQALADELGLAVSARDPEGQLTRALQGRGDLLVVLDNFEQLVIVAADLVVHWLRSAPSLRLLVTSRHALRLDAEHSLRIGSLPLQGAAVQLLSHRMKQASHHFRGVNDDNIEDIHAIVTLLDGLPLALELAASQVRMLSVTKLRARLDQGLSWLIRPGRSQRQGTLAGALQWSYELLDPSHREALAQCSVFTGDFSIEAAEAVLQLGPQTTALHAVQCLIDHSLLGLHLDGDEPRFVLLRAVREFAATHLHDDGAAAARHGAFYARLAQSVSGYVDRDVLRPELHNLELAFRTAVDRRDIDCAFHTGQGLLRCDVTDNLARAQSVADDLLCMGLTPTQRLDIALFAAKTKGQAVGPTDGVSAYRAARVLAEEVGSEAQIAECDEFIGYWLSSAGMREQAQESLNRARERYVVVGDRRREALTLRLLGVVNERMGRTDTARDYLQRGLSIGLEHGWKTVESLCLSSLATLTLHEGDLTTCKDLHLRALEGHKLRGSPRAAAMEQGNLGHLQMRQGLVESSWRNVSESKDFLDELGNTTHTNQYNLGVLQVYRGDLNDGQHRLAAIRDVARAAGRTMLCDMANGQLAQVRALRAWHNPKNVDIDIIIGGFSGAEEALAITGNREAVTEVLLHHAAFLLRLMRARGEGAQRCAEVLDRAQEHATFAKARIALAEVQVARAELCALRGEYAAAIHMLNEAQAVLTRSAAHQALAMLHVTRARIHALAGRAPDGSLDEATAMTQRLGMGDRSALGCAIAEVLQSR